jgi:excisionase family DNA binding protein
MGDLLMTATAHAVAYAKDRSGEEVTPDDLLLGSLQAAARLGVAGLGPLDIDLSGEPPVPSGNGPPRVRPRYAPDTAALFDRASSIARDDGEPRVRLVHLLAALGGSDCALMLRLRERYGFDDAGWRSALAAWDRTRQRGTEIGTEKKSLLTVDDAAEALGVHQQTIRGYIRSGKLPAYRIAGERAIRVFATDLYGLLEPVEPNAEEDEV